MKTEVVKNAITLMEWLEKLPDSRDNRGKRHTLSFVPVGVLMAIQEQQKLYVVDPPVYSQ